LWFARIIARAPGMSIPGPFLRAERGEPKSMLMPIWTLLLAAIWLAGCAPQGTINRDQVFALTVGRTTSAQVTAAWGAPSRDVAMQDGGHVLTYHYIHIDLTQSGPFATTSSEFGPLGNPSTTVTGQVRLTFDPRGVLLNYAMYGQG